MIGVAHPMHRSSVLVAFFLHSLPVEVSKDWLTLVTNIALLIGKRCRIALGQLVCGVRTNQPATDPLPIIFSKTGSPNGI